MRTLILVCFIWAAPLSAFAAHEGPCKQILAKCEAAGFKLGGHKKGGKGAKADCLDKIMAGSAVAGVTTSPDEVKACQDAKAKHHKK